MPTILVIEDDSAIRRGVTDALRFSGYTVLEASSGLHALEVVDEMKGKIDLIGVTNFNGGATRGILDSGVPLATTQVQYSVLDDRVEMELSISRGSTV